MPEYLTHLHDATDDEVRAWVASVPMPHVEHTPESPWWINPVAVYDLETTGPDPEVARMVTAHVSLTLADATVTNTLDILVNPGVPIPEGAQAVHGISDQLAATGMPPRTATLLLVALMGAYSAARIPVVAFNGAYDFTVLDREAGRYGLDPHVPTLVIDPFVIDKYIDKYRRGSRKLGDVARHYGVDLTNAHEASADAIAAGLLARALATSTPIPAPFDPADLHARQVQFRRAWAHDFQQHLRKTDPAAVVDGSWPVYPRTGGDA